MKRLFIGRSILILLALQTFSFAHAQAEEANQAAEIELIELVSAINHSEGTCSNANVTAYWMSPVGANLPKAILIDLGTSNLILERMSTSVRKRIEIDGHKETAWIFNTHDRDGRAIDIVIYRKTWFAPSSGVYSRVHSLKIDGSPICGE